MFERNASSHILQEEINSSMVTRKLTKQVSAVVSESPNPVKKTSKNVDEQSLSVVQQETVPKDLAEEKMNESTINTEMDEQQTKSKQEFIPKFNETQQKQLDGQLRSVMSLFNFTNYLVNNGIPFFSTFNC